MVLALLPWIAFVVTLAMILALRPLAISIALVDRPSGRKAHKGEIPLIGGVAIFLSLLITVFIGVLLSGEAIASDRWLIAFFSGCYLLVVVGVYDDWRGLSPAIRLTVEVVAALIMITQVGVVLTDIGAISLSGTTVFLGYFAIPFTVFATVGVINAVNMCDGLDGLSGLLILVMLAGLGLANTMWGTPTEAPLLNILSGAVAGFLAFNQRMVWRNKAWVFLGDAGSMMLGYALVWIVIDLSQGSPRVISPAEALWFLAVPLLDTVTIMVRRLLKGHSPFRADREHLHHLLTRSGCSVGSALTIICGMAVAGCVLGMLFRYYLVPDLIVAVAFIATGVVYLLLMEYFWRTGNLFGRPIE